MSAWRQTLEQTLEELRRLPGLWEGKSSEVTLLFLSLFSFQTVPISQVVVHVFCTFHCILLCLNEKNPLW